MKVIAAGVRWIDWINEKVGFAASWLTTLLVLVVCFNVFTRRFLDMTPVSMQELEWHLFALIFLFGAAYTLKYDRHVRVDLVYARLGPKGKAWVNLLGSLLFLVPFCGFVIWASIDFVHFSFMDGEGSPNPDGLPGRYVLKACIPIAFAILLLQGLSLAGRSLLVIRGHEEEKAGGA